MKTKGGRTWHWYFYLIVIVILATGVASSVFVAGMTSRNIKTSILARSNSMAELITPATIAQLQGSDKDLSSPVYKNLKAQFIRIYKDNSDIRFVYLLGVKPGHDSFFYVDSEDPNSKDYSPPGQAYPEGNADVQSIFDSKTGRVLPIEKDSYGSWLSSFSPVMDYSNNKVVAVLGIDVASSSYYARVATNAGVTALLTIILLSTAFWVYHRQRLAQQYLTQKAFFLSFASHEIRSPLTSVSWALDAVSSGKVSSPREMLTHTNDSVKNILSTIEDVLNLQSMEKVASKKLKTEPASISELIDEVVTTLRLMQAEHNVIIHNLTAPDNQQFSANIDRVLFKRALSNLLTNAIKYAPENTNVNVHLIQDAGAWIVQIHNDGPGISPEDQAKILGGNYRTKEAEKSNQKGNGLGMILTRQIIEHHNGKLEIESKTSQGATFRIIIPKK